ncbi:MAG: hypothetical protein ABSA49_08165, partial [Rhizomicrobium sp.]
MFVIIDPQAQLPERLDYFDGDGTDLRVHSFGAEQARRVQIVLHAILDDGERRIHHIQMRIDAERGCEEHLAVHRVAVEEIAVVEIAVGARSGDGLRQLVNGIVVGF